MKKTLGLVLAFVMAFTVFAIPGSVFAEDEATDGVQATTQSEPAVEELEDPEPPAQNPVAPSVEKGAVTADKTSVTLNWSYVGDYETMGYTDYGVDITLKDKQFDTSKKTYSGSATETKFTGLSDGVVYSYVVKFHFKGEGLTDVAGQFSGTITTAANKQNGWYTSGNNQYYYQNGVKARKKTIKLATGGVKSYNIYHYFNDEGIFLGRSANMYSKIKGLSSKTYLICVDRKNNVCCVYKGGKNKWRPYKYFSCVTGRPGHGTPCGTHHILSKKMTFAGYGVPDKKKNRYSVWYCTRFKGSIFFHSQLYKYGTKSSFIPGGGVMGVNASHGCVRLNINYSKWIYNSCAVGTTVRVIK